VRKAGSGSQPRPEQFEISGTDLKPADSNLLPVTGAGASAFTLRDQPVMLAADVALIFGVATREIVQNIKANPDIFPEKYAFELIDAEVEELRSAGLISKPGRGGSRAKPWVVTRKGAIRLATIMKSPQAIRAADIFIDIFDDMVGQLQAGAQQVAIPSPSQLVSTEQDLQLVNTARERLAGAITALFNTVIDVNRNTTVGEELQEVSSEALNHIKAWLRGKALTNDKLEAETMLVIEQARDMYERRQADLADKALDRERKVLDNVIIRIKATKEMIDMYHQLEPNALVQLTTGFRTVLPSLEHKK